MIRRALILLLAALSLPMLLLAGGGSQATAASKPIPGFEVFCYYSHSAKDDPILMPNMPGMFMHQHEFSGNTTTTASSTPASLKAGGTNCELSADTAAYWTPTLYSKGRPVHPDRLHSYYRWGQIKDYAHIRPMPEGLKMVAGNALATAPQSTSVIGWNCGVQGATLYNHPVSCHSGQKIVLHVFFPNCWDGVHLDSADHRSHVAYSYHGSCPKTHPVAIPRLSEDYGFPLVDATGITLASGSYMTAHADFWNTWNQSAMRRLTVNCINKGRQCGPQKD
jgi:Domain of unknown function (DUF1996)